MSTRPRTRRLLLAAAISILPTAFISLFLVRATVAQVYEVPNAAVAPEIPTGARVLVYKPASTFNPGDIVAFNHSPNVWLARVETHDTAARTLTLSHNNTPGMTVSADTIIGRVVLTTR